MVPASAGTRILASLAILLLLSFGFVAYAVPGTANVSPPASGSATAAANNPGSDLYFQLVQVASSAGGPAGANASGSAGISISGQSLSIEWSVKGAMPGELLQLDVQAAAINSTGTSKSFTVATVHVNSDGEAGSTGSATLDPGYYSIGLTVVDPSPSSSSTVLTSDPASAQVAIASSQDNQTQTAKAIGSALSYSLVPLPVYLEKDAPSNYSFREGGALIVVSGNQLQVTTSFLGAANTEFINVVQTTHQNITAGMVTTTSTGGGVFKGNVTLEPGTYDVGLLVFVFGNTSSPVAVSVPRAIQVTLPVTTQPSSTTTSSRSSSSSSTRDTTVSTSHTTTTTSSTSPPETVDQLQFAPVTVPTAPKGYLYGKGSGGFAVTGGSIYFNLLFSGQNPDARYSLVLSVNGTSRTIGNYTTNAEGSATSRAGTTLGTGKFALSLSVVDLTNFNAPTVVLASVPSSFTVVVQASSTSSSTGSTSTGSAHPLGPEWSFKLEPAAVGGVPPGYHFATSGTAVVTLDAHYSVLRVVLGFQDANPSTTYSAALVLNGTSVNLGSMTTNRGGGAELHSSIQVNPGRYLIGIEVYDVSDVAEFNANGPVLVMLSDPNTQLAVIVPTNAESSSTSFTTSSGAEGSATSQSEVTSTVTTPATTISAGSEVEAQIQNAVTNLTIPATVQITPLASSTTVLDSRFSLSVGQQVGNGLVIAISGENVTGPRVLLINMSRTAPLALYPSLNVTLDGVPVVEANSALQVLNPTSSDPPRYVLIGTADSIQLLVSIPHFSLHLIQIAGQLVHNIQASLALDAPILAGSILVVTLAFAAAYAARRRYFSILL
ncbi:MAG TPA: hypothetical protein VND40_04190 [Nitrososphaerales archaeon]|nr:hypothetical protein [Nitrososphaerales archaeon]